MFSIRKAAAMGAIAAVALGATACGARDTSGGTDSSSTAAGSDKQVSIGIAMPQKTSQNWVEAEKLFIQKCEEINANCDIQFANGGVSEQQNQIGAMITKGVDVLLIGAIDGSQLGSQLDQARAAGIKIVAYDRLLTNTKNIDYYIAYDNFHVGELQGQALLDGLGKEKGSGPYKIEVFGGSPDDSNSLKFFNGAMSVLQPKIDDGTLVVGSGQSEYSQAATQGWDPKNAQTRMDSLLASTYPGTEAPDGVLSPNDTLARAILTSIGDKRERPVVTGQDSEDESVTLVAKGEQYSTIFKDTRYLVEQSVKLAEQLAKGEEPNLGDVKLDDKQYESMEGNPVKSYLLSPVIVTKDNAAEVYKDDELRAKLVADATK
ncbi:MAG: sugar ABC transporter substrate-binding protein [Actinomycetaceae bacterium]|nr:sugar ABC transporter substrate-binding protein [Actinomycetaceae bacterium]